MKPGTQLKHLKPGTILLDGPNEWRLTDQRRAAHPRQDQVLVVGISEHVQGFELWVWENQKWIVKRKAEQ